MATKTPTNKKSQKQETSSVNNTIQEASSSTRSSDSDATISPPNLKLPPPSNEESWWLHYTEWRNVHKLGLNDKIPILGHKTVDLFLLWTEVTKRGGLELVHKHGLFRYITPAFELPKSCTNASFALRRVYSRFLLKYEKEYLKPFSETQIQQVLKKDKSDKRSKSSYSSKPLQVSKKTNKALISSLEKISKISKKIDLSSFPTKKNLPIRKVIDDMKRDDPIFSILSKILLNISTGSDYEIQQSLTQLLLLTDPDLWSKLQPTSHFPPTFSFIFLPGLLDHLVKRLRIFLRQTESFVSTLLSFSPKFVIPAPREDPNPGQFSDWDDLVVRRFIPIIEPFIGTPTSVLPQTWISPPPILPSSSKLHSWTPPRPEAISNDLQNTKFDDIIQTHLDDYRSQLEKDSDSPNPLDSVSPTSSEEPRQTYIKKPDPSVQTSSSRIATASLTLETSEASATTINQDESASSSIRTDLFSSNPHLYSSISDNDYIETSLGKICDPSSLSLLSRLWSRNTSLELTDISPQERDFLSQRGHTSNFTTSQAKTNKTKSKSKNPQSSSSTNDDTNSPSVEEEETDEADGDTDGDGGDNETEGDDGDGSDSTENTDPSTSESHPTKMIQDPLPNVLSAFPNPPWNEPRWKSHSPLDHIPAPSTPQSSIVDLKSHFEVEHIIKILQILLNASMNSNLDRIYFSAHPGLIDILLRYSVLVQEYGIILNSSSSFTFSDSHTSYQNTTKHIQNTQKPDFKTLASLHALLNRIIPSSVPLLSNRILFFLSPHLSFTKEALLNLPSVVLADSMFINQENEIFGRERRRISRARQIARKNNQWYNVKTIRASAHNRDGSTTNNPCSMYWEEDHLLHPTLQLLMLRIYSSSNILNGEMVTILEDTVRALSNSDTCSFICAHLLDDIFSPDHVYKIGDRSRNLNKQPSPFLIRLHEILFSYRKFPQLASLVLQIFGLLCSQLLANKTNNDIKSPEGVDLQGDNLPNSQNQNSSDISTNYHNSDNGQEFIYSTKSVTRRKINLPHLALIRSNPTLPILLLDMFYDSLLILRWFISLLHNCQPPFSLTILLVWIDIAQKSLVLLHSLFSINPTWSTPQISTLFGKSIALLSSILSPIHANVSLPFWMTYYPRDDSLISETETESAQEIANLEMLISLFYKHSLDSLRKRHKRYESSVSSFGSMSLDAFSAPDSTLTNPYKSNNSNGNGTSGFDKTQKDNNFVIDEFLNARQRKQFQNLSTPSKTYLDTLSKAFWTLSLQSQALITVLGSGIKH